MKPIPHVTEGLPFSARKPFLIVGKGPTSEKYSSLMTADFNVVGINQVAVRVPGVAWGHFLDYEPFIDAMSALHFHQDETKGTPQFVIVPWVFHWAETPMERTLDKYIRFDNALRRFHEEGRLFSYDLHSAPIRNWRTKVPMIAMNSSAEAVLSIISQVGGMKTVYTLGMDGGMERARAHSEDYREIAVPYDIHKSQFLTHASDLGLTVIDLGSKV